MSAARKKGVRASTATRAPTVAYSPARLAAAAVPVHLVSVCIGISFSPCLVIQCAASRRARRPRVALFLIGDSICDVCALRFDD